MIKYYYFVPTSISQSKFNILVSGPKSHSYLPSRLNRVLMIRVRVFDEYQYTNISLLPTRINVNIMYTNTIRPFPLIVT